jgi:hypothetical protein
MSTFGVAGTTMRIAAPGVAEVLFPHRLYGLATDGTFVYGAWQSEDLKETIPANLIHLKPNGHGVLSLSKSRKHDIAVDESYVYFFNQELSAIQRACKAP